MRRPSFAVLCALGSVLVAPLLASAQTTAETTSALTLEEIIAAANANYPAIRAAQSQQRAAHKAIGVAKTAYLPRTDILWQTDRATANNVLGLMLPQSTVPSVTGSVLAADVTRSAWNSTGGALVSWQPFDFGVRGAKVEVARQSGEAARQASILTQLQVSANAGSAFFDLAAAEQLANTAQANVRWYESFDKAVHVLVDNTLRPGADASQADAQLAVARNQLIQAGTQVAVKRAALAAYLQSKNGQAEVDASGLLSAPPVSDLAVITATSHPIVLEEHALSLQQEAQKRFLDRSYVPVFSTSGVVFGRGAGTSAAGPFPGGTAGLAPDILNWAAGVQVAFSAFDFFNLRISAGHSKRMCRRNMRDSIRRSATLQRLCNRRRRPYPELATGGKHPY
jgi:outer membrane protein